MLNTVESGIVMLIHRYRFSSEMQVLLRGRIDLIFYDDSGIDLERFVLDPRTGRYVVSVTHGQWHNFEVLDSSVVFGAKDGAYTPPEAGDVLA